VSVRARALASVRVGALAQAWAREAAGWGSGTKVGKVDGVMGCGSGAVGGGWGLRYGAGAGVCVSVSVPSCPFSSPSLFPAASLDP
jgi:hypothetical protein